MNKNNEQVYQDLINLLNFPCDRCANSVVGITWFHGTPVVTLGCAMESKMETAQDTGYCFNLEENK